MVDGREMGRVFSAFVLVMCLLGFAAGVVVALLIK